MSEPRSATVVVSEELFPHQPYSASDATIHFWAVGAMADYMLYLPFNGLILPFFATSFMLNPKLVGWA